MKILIIGGTGTISSAITRQLAESNNELWLLNRGNRKNEVPANVKQVIADIDDAPEEPRYELDESQAVACLRHHVLTNGIVYACRYFDMRRMGRVKEHFEYRKQNPAIEVTGQWLLENPDKADIQSEQTAEGDEAHRHKCQSSNR